MGGRSKSSSANTNTSYNIDRRIAAAEGSMILADGSAADFSNRSSNSYSSTINYVDPGAMAVAGQTSRDAMGLAGTALQSNAQVYGRAMEYSGAALDRAATTAERAAAATVEFGGAALDRSLDYGSEALAFGKGALDGAYVFGDNALSRVDEATERALAFANQSLSLVQRSHEDAYKFASDATKPSEERSYSESVKWAALVGVSYFAVRAMGVLK